VRKKGGRIRDTHINRLKFYDPENSSSDEKVHLSNNEDLGTPDATQTEDSEQKGDIQPSHGTPEERTTRSKSNKLPPPIQRFTASTEIHGGPSQPQAINYHNQILTTQIVPIEAVPSPTTYTTRGAEAYRWFADDFTLLFQPMSSGTQHLQQ
jgi:hypothetical protein